MQILVPIYFLNNIPFNVYLGLHRMGFSICGAQFRWRRQTVESYAWEGWKNMLYPLWDTGIYYQSNNHEKKTIKTMR
jgi:hypothetical protein